MLHPLLEARRPRLGDIMLHEDSIIILTSNGSSDNIGDDIRPHTYDRVTTLNVRKPTVGEWLEWAVPNGVSPVICAYVDRNPHVLASYLDSSQKENPFIFNPKRVQHGGFVTPRSLASAGSLVENRARLSGDSDDMLRAALAGTLGAAAAADIDAFVRYQDEIPTFESILLAPKKAKVPSSPGACAVAVFGLVIRCDTTEKVNAVFDYIEGFHAEWQTLFAKQMVADKSRRSIAAKAKRFMDWCNANGAVL
jgi:hypothetical protein